MTIASPILSIHPVVAYLSTYGELTADDRAFLLDKAEREDLPRHRIVYGEGQVCQYMYLIVKGLLRSHYNKDGRNVTTYFLTDGAFTTPLASLLNRQPSNFTLETLEPTTLYRLHYADLRTLFQRSHGFEHLSRVATLDSLMGLESRVFALQFYTAQERYTNFLTQFPGLINRVSLTHVASYLGVSLETISRIRANLTNVKQKR